MRDNTKTIIESLGVYLPQESISTNDVLLGCEKQIRFPLEKISGIKNRRMAGQNEFAIDLARKAIADCLEKSKYNAEDIDLLICCNISRYDGPEILSFEPCTSIKLRKHFDFKNAIAFDITNACAGMFTGIYIVNALLETGAVRRGMVVSGEYITYLTKNAQKEIESFMDPKLACLTLGDAGAAVILERGIDTHTGFQEINLQTLGRYSSYCIGKATETGGWTMITDSVNMADAAIKFGAKNALGTLQSAGWSPDAFQHLVMHQTSTMTMNSARQEINHLLKSRICHDGNTINNLEHRGNTASTSHFIAINDNIYSNKINSRDKVIFIVAASGLTIGTALYIFDDLPDRLRQMESPLKLKTHGHINKYPGSGSHVVSPGIRIESVGTVLQGTIENKNSVELLHTAAINCLEKSSYVCNDIGLLIHSGVYRTEYIMEPAIAALLAGRLEMNATLPAPGETLAFDIFNGSIGFLNACYIAQQMIGAGKCKRAMIVASEIENNAGLFPDKLTGVCEAASAIILDAHPMAGKGFSRILFNYHEESINAYTAYCFSRDNKICLSVQKDTDLEKKYIACIVPVVEELLQQEELNLDQIDIVFPPQISSGFIGQLSEQLNLPLKRFVDVVEEGPDLFSSSLAYGMEYAYNNELIKPGHIGLIIAVGSGIQVGCAIYKF
jgi:3-oxoacyl-[acyl-carrier-protein] synthase III